MPLPQDPLFPAGLTTT